MAHEFQVKVMLTAEEYVAFKHVCDEIGTTQSGMMRMLAKEKIRAHALSMASPAPKPMDEMGHE